MFNCRTNQYWATLKSVLGKIGFFATHGSFWPSVAAFCSVLGNFSSGRKVWFFDFFKDLYRKRSSKFLKVQKIFEFHWQWFSDFSPDLPEISTSFILISFSSHLRDSQLFSHIPENYWPVNFLKGGTPNTSGSAVIPILVCQGQKRFLINEPNKNADKKSVPPRDAGCTLIVASSR